MQAKKNIKNQTPLVFPQGWKKATAEAIGVHINTITNNLKKGKGETYNRIIYTAKQIYGIPITK